MEAYYLYLPVSDQNNPIYQVARKQPYGTIFWRTLYITPDWSLVHSPSSTLGITAPPHQPVLCCLFCLIRTHLHCLEVLCDSHFAGLPRSPIFVICWWPIHDLFRKSVVIHPVNMTQPPQSPQAEDILYVLHSYSFSLLVMSFHITLRIFLCNVWWADSSSFVLTLARRIEFCNVNDGGGQRCTPITFMLDVIWS